ncbi:MAG: LPS export ABC transporter periplasmic protein LptC [Comamonadaceae bacterium]|nr:MAG: LPS export ABC transporter periplasmic protein LptC [Comamonadaceae bacterium]
MNPSAAVHPTPRQRARAGWRKVLALWDGVAIYLPLLMMGILALGTYWLVRNTPGPGATESAREVRHDPDYFMRRFSVKNFDAAGKLKSEILGVEARHYPDTDTLEIDQARIRSISPKGLLTVATGNRAISNSDGSEVQLTGNAIVVREAGVDNTGKPNERLEFRGEFLHAFLNEERVRSHKPVILTRGNDQFTGDTFAYDNLDGVAELKGRVRGVMMPRQATPARPAAR